MKKETITKLLELYNNAVKNKKTGFDVGVNYMASTPFFRHLCPSVLGRTA